MKRFLILFVFSALLFSTHAKAQQTNYTVHTITKGETLSMLAKKYRTTVGDIMRLNGMNSKSKLQIGQKIKIPPASSTAEKKPVANPSAKTKPVNSDSEVTTHYVLQNETLYSISKKFGVTVEQLKEWNNLSSDNIHFGQQLIVSHVGTKSVPTKNKEAAQTNTDTTQTTLSNPPVVKDKKRVSQNNPVTQSDNETPKIQASENDSYFANGFLSAKEASLKSVTGYASIFKTTEGAKDKKYYIFMNGLPLGTIVKVSSPNGNSIYAKVLWTLDTTLNYGLNFRIDDAAASVLAVNQQPFSLIVQYHE